MTEMYNLSVKMKSESKGKDRALMYGHLPMAGKTNEENVMHIV